MFTWLENLASMFTFDILDIEKNSHFGEALTANLSGLWRYRVGDFRIICEIQDEKVIVLILTIGHRREIYK